MPSNWAVDTDVLAARFHVPMGPPVSSLSWVLQDS